MSRKYFFRALLMQMDLRQMGFKELAAELKLPEEEVQAMFDNQDCSFTCMENMCHVLGLKFEELISTIPKPKPVVMIQHLTQQQEVEILSQKKCWQLPCAL